LEGALAASRERAHNDAADVCSRARALDPLPPVTKAEDAQYPHGSNHFHEGFSDPRFDPQFPLYYGRLDDMVLVFMMGRERSSQFIPYMSPTGGGYSQECERTNPAWDHRFLLKGLQPGERVTIRQRVCYMRYTSDADILQEYEKWLEERRD